MARTQETASRTGNTGVRTALSQTMLSVRQAQRVCAIARRPPCDATRVGDHNTHRPRRAQQAERAADSACRMQCDHYARGLSQLRGVCTKLTDMKRCAASRGQDANKRSSGLWRTAAAQRALQSTAQVQGAEAENAVLTTRIHTRARHPRRAHTHTHIHTQTGTAQRREDATAGGAAATTNGARTPRAYRGAS